MALKDFQQETAVIKSGNVMFTVTGLDFNALTRLIIDAESAVGEAFDMFQRIKEDSGEEAMFREGLEKLLRELPDLAARIIATAAGEPEYWSNATHLPGPTQLEALAEIGRMTFTEPDSLKKFVQNLQAATRNFKSLPKANELNGSGGTRESAGT